MSVSDAETLATIRQAFTADLPYLLDPHGAVAVTAARKVLSQYPAYTRMVCLATAHPAKFPDIITNALGTSNPPVQAVHPSLEQMRTRCRHLRICDLKSLASAWFVPWIRQNKEICSWQSIPASPLKPSHPCCRATTWEH